MYPSSLEGRLAWLVMIVSILLAIGGLAFAAQSSPSEFQRSEKAKMYFPYASCAAQADVDYWNVTVLLVFFQFPVYAAVCVAGALGGRLRPVVVTLGMAHGAGIVMSYLL